MHIALLLIWAWEGGGSSGTLMQLSIQMHWQMLFALKKASASERNVGKIDSWNHPFLMHVTGIHKNYTYNL